MKPESFASIPRRTAVLAGLAATALGAQTPDRVADLNPDLWFETKGGLCREHDWTPHAERFPELLFADPTGDGCRVYEVDPASATVTPVAHLGEFGARVGEVLGEAGDLVFFEGITAATGRELWRTDGTPEGTFLLLDATPGPISSFGFHDFAAGVSLSYFHRFLPETGWEPWRTDGTPEGTALLADLNPGPADSTAGWNSGFRSNGFLGPLFFFIADDGSAGPEIWRTDGTAAGTFSVTSFEAEPYSDLRVDFAALPSAMLFSVWLYGEPVELWRIDESAIAAERLLTFPVGNRAHVRPLAVRGDRALLEIDSGGSIHLWVTDGSVDGTRHVITMPQAATPSVGRPLPVAGGWIFFARDEAHGIEPWTTEGTAAGTHLVADVRPGPESSADPRWTDSTATLGDGVLVRLDDGVHGFEMWVTDGTTGGTRLVRDLEPGRESSWLELLGEREGYELFVYEGRLWRTDGTAAGTLLVADFGRSVSPSDPLRLEGVGDRLYFDGRQERWGRHPFRSDGTEAGTHWLGTAPLEWLYGPTHFAALGDGSYVANTDYEGDGRYGYSKLWSGDEHFVPLAKLVYGCGARCTTGLGHAPPVAGGFALYVDWTPDLGEEVWRTDGTPDGTSPVIDLVPGPESGGPSELHPSEGEVWFTAVDADGIESVWRSRGTPETTEAVLALPGTTATYSRSVLWPIDATAGSCLLQRSENGTPILRFSSGFGQPPAVVASGVHSLASEPLGVVGGRVLFSGATYPESPTGHELWVSDGTKDGTRLLRDLWPGEPDSLIGAGVVVAGRVIFPACEPAGGCELWASDGTEAGTGRFLDLEPGPGSSRPFGLSRIGSRLYFAACTVANGCEPYLSNGTAGGTVRLAEIAPGPVSSIPYPMLEWYEWEEPPWDLADPAFVEAGDRIFFAADDGTGTELWAIVHGVFRDGFESGDTGRWSDAQPLARPFVRHRGAERNEGASDDPTSRNAPRGS